MKKMTTTMLASFCGLSVAGAAIAGFSPTMFQVPTDPSSWAGSTLVASLNAQADGFSFAPNSGFAAYFLTIELDRTHVQTDVYRVGNPMNITTGSSTLSLNVGDLVFAYRVRLVNDFPGLTVSSLKEAQVVGAPDFGFGQDPMDASRINGQGYVVPGHPRPPLVGNMDDAGEFGSSVDFEWGLTDTQQLRNGDLVTLLLFTDPSLIGRGVLNLSAPPGQPAGVTGVAQANEAPPVLIPLVPSPGPILLAGIGLGVILTARRRGR